MEVEDTEMEDTVMKDVDLDGFASVPMNNTSIAGSSERNQQDTDLQLEEPGPSLPPAVEVEGDRVVREIEVFLTPRLDPETGLYLLQYPLRPSWRPYGLEERCQEARLKLQVGNEEVRLKPKAGRMEVDLVVDTEAESYNADAPDALLIKHQTLASSKISLLTDYAIGVLRGNQLYLNPVQAVVQLRPSLRHLDEADAAKKSLKGAAGGTGEGEEGEGEEGESKEEAVALQVQIRRHETERQEESRLQSHAYLKALEEAEPWIRVEPSAAGSMDSIELREKMALGAAAHDLLPFNLSREEYIESLGAGKASSGAVETPPTDGSGGSSEARVLEVLQQRAVLVQGCWVAASFLRFQGPVCVVRDFLLLLFTRHRNITREMLEPLRVPKELLRELLSTLALQKGAAAGWEFVEETDKAFLRRHPGIAKEQSARWQQAEQGIRQAAMRLDISSMEDLRAKGGRLTPPAAAGGPPGGAGGASGGGPHPRGGGGIASTSSTPGGGEAEGQGHLAMAGWGEGRGSLRFIAQSLRELPIAQTSSSKPNPKAVALAVAASHAASAPLPELAAAVSQVASNIEGVYFLPSLGNSSLDPFSLRFIAQSLRELPIAQTSSSKPNPKAVALAVAASHAASAPLPELAAAVSQVASNIEGVYFLPSLGNSSLDPFRDLQDS
eukprot:jgi/Mesen1/2237/ME000152S01322